jgi:capsular polysaccharide biosynthesis protein
MPKIIINEIKVRHSLILIVRFINGIHIRLKSRSKYFLLITKSIIPLVRFFIRNKIKKNFYNNKSSLTLNQKRSSNVINIEKINYFKYIKLIGGSSIYIVNDEAHYPEPIDVSLDRFAEEYRGFFEYNYSEKKIEISSHYIKAIELDYLSINLMGGVANNYAHWLSEILPRLFYFIQDNQLKKITIIVNYDIHINLICSILKLIKNLDIVNILKVDNGILLNIKNFCNISNIGYCQFEPRFAGSTPYVHLNPNLIRQMALKLGEEIEPKKIKKIYLERSSNIRGIINHLEVKSLLENHGFVTCNTDILSFDDQVSLFKGVEIVIGATGAAFANCIFCKDGAKIFILTTTNKNHLLSYWPSLLGGDRLNIKYIKQSIYDESEGTSASFRVDLNSLLSVLKKFS